MCTEETKPVEEWKKFIDKDLKSPYGWLDQRGNYFSCGWMEHSDMMLVLQANGFLPDLDWKGFEECMVKITKTFHGAPAILTYQKVLTARQKLTLSDLIPKMDLITPDTQYHLVADQEITLQDGKVKFTRIDIG